jgi:hypothetical protein
MTIVTVIINLLTIKICYYNTYYVHFRAKNFHCAVLLHKWRQTWERRMVLFDTSSFWGISTKVSGLWRHVFKNRPGTIPELMQVITDTCNLIDAPTLQRSFENMKRRVTLYFKFYCFIILGEEIILQPTGHT